MEFEVVRPSVLAPADRARWNALLAADVSLQTPFLTPGWAAAVERAQEDEETKLNDPRGVRIVILRDEGQAKGFLPVRVGRSIAMPAGAPMNDYQGLAADPTLRFNRRALLKALGVARLDFTHMLSGQPWFAGYVRGVATTYQVEAPNGYAAYAETRRAAGSGILKDIEKRRRKLERDLGPVVLTAHSRASDALDQLIAWKQRRFAESGQTDIFLTPWTQKLLRELHASGDSDFGGVLFTLHAGEQLVAAQFNLRSHATLHAWIIGHDAAVERHSPGLILFGDILRWMDESPFRTLDLGAGDYRFKQQLANAQRQVGHGFVGRPSPVSLLRTVEYGLRDTAERLPLGAMSMLPGKAMRRLDLWRGLN